MSQILSKVKMLVGLNYKHMGRLLELPETPSDVHKWNEKGIGVDCLGIVIVIYDKGLGHPVPDYATVKYKQDWYKGVFDKRYLMGFSKYFFKVDFPEVWDCIMFKCNSKAPNHTGVYIGNNKFIHSHDNSTVSISPLTGYWKRMCYGFYRIKI